MTLRTALLTLLMLIGCRSETAPRTPHSDLPVQDAPSYLHSDANREYPFSVHTVPRNRDYNTFNSLTDNRTRTSGSTISRHRERQPYREHQELEESSQNLSDPSDAEEAARLQLMDRRRLQDLTLMIERLGDRIIALQSTHTQRAERIDTIHYRLTKIEVLVEEQKGSLGELSNSVRHRLQTSDFEMEKIKDALDEIRLATASISVQNTRTQAILETQQASELSAASQQSVGGPLAAKGVKAVIAAVNGVRSLTQEVADQVNVLVSNLTKIENITRALDTMTTEGVTKPFIRSSLAELDRRHPLLGMKSLMVATLNGGCSAVLPPQQKEPVDCYEVLQRSPEAPSGVYMIQPQYASTPFFAYCDMDTEGGGWTILQRRQDGSVDFLREWLDYKYGFGNLAGEFWLGNEKIHLLTNQHVSELLIKLSDFGQETALARYSAFAIGGEEEGFSLTMLGHYSGDAGDSLSYHVGQRFSTIDSDSDAWPDQNCARDHRGAWWYRACDTSNLNGQYLHGPVPADHEYHGIYWYDFRGPSYSLWKTQMMVRRGGSVTGEPIVNKSVSGTRAQGDESSSATGQGQTASDFAVTSESIRSDRVEASVTPSAPRHLPRNDYDEYETYPSYK